MRKSAGGSVGIQHRERAGCRIGAERFCASLVPLAEGHDGRGGERRTRQSGQGPGAGINSETLDGGRSAVAVESEAVDELAAGMNLQVQWSGSDRGDRRIVDRRQGAGRWVNGENVQVVV